MGAPRRRATIVVALVLPVVAAATVAVLALGGFAPGRPASAAPGVPEPGEHAPAAASPSTAGAARAEPPSPALAAGSPTATGTATASTASALLGPTGSAAASAAASATGSRAVDPAPQRIFVFGDSMVINMLQRLADYALENGHELSAAIWYGSTSAAWGSGGKLEQLLLQRDPTFVLVVLGSSEMTSVETKIGAASIQRVIDVIGKRKWAWVGPLHWRDDAVYNAMLERLNGAGHFFRSTEIKFRDVGDHVHPTPEAGAKWADAIAAWIVAESDVPIRMALPTRVAPKPNPLVFPPPY
ncbi:MAG: SGNH/GDSL hydrolase family protein [Polyangiaceae bacterium]|nr:SGNH/GDSL hydrolase family protein [Polyangiaceae bacterium]